METVSKCDVRHVAQFLRVTAVPRDERIKPGKKQMEWIKVKAGWYESEDGIIRKEYKKSIFGSAGWYVWLFGISDYLGPFKTMKAAKVKLVEWYKREWIARMTLYAQVYLQSIRDNIL